MRWITARFRTLLCCALALALLVPATASSAHNLTHVLPAIGADSHHHHGANHAAPAGDLAPEPDGHDGGHDHLLGLSFPLGALFEAAQLVHPPLPATVAPEAEVATLTLRPAEPPPADPPRHA